MTELLAPAGSMDALRAAIANGANAVYLGGKQFSARAFADNFTIEEINQAVELAHFHGVRVYVAVNTLVADKELMAMLFYAAELYRAGVDAVIVQDLGLVRLLHYALPDLPLHASTQMTVMNPDLTPILRDLGITRVILPRELSFADLRQFQDRSVLEAEVFVHGALCVCYSGQCLFSSMVGGRSGNRGKCAQPCRMAYQLCDAFGDPVADWAEGKYLLSPRDLFGYGQLDALHDLGLAAWKIEGRMKRPQYVATVTRIYARALAKLDLGLPAPADPEDLRQLTQVFNRDHNTGYWLGNPGASLMSYKRPNNRGLFLGRVMRLDQGRMLVKLSQPLHRGDGIEVWVSGQREGRTVEHIWLDGAEQVSVPAGVTVELPAVRCQVGDRVFKTYDAPLMESAELSYQHLKDKPLHFSVHALLGEKLAIRAWDEDGYQAEVTSSYVVEPAKNSQKPMEIAFAQLGRLGGTGYTIGKLTGEVYEAAMLPTSVLNQCRRQLVEDILGQRRAKDRGRKFDHVRFSTVLKAAEPRSSEKKLSGLPELVALVENPQKALSAVKRGVRDIYFDAVGWSGREPIDYPQLASAVADQGGRLIPYLPQVILPHEETHWVELLEQWKKCRIEAMVINNLGQAALFRAHGWDRGVYGGSGLNVFNAPACRLLADQDIRRILLSPELTLEHLQQLDGSGCETEVFIHGPLQLMVSEYCLLGAVLGGRDCQDGKAAACTRPCRRTEPLCIKDEKGYTFPIRCDAACRMHVFNSRELCLLEELPELSAAGVARGVLDLRTYDQQRAERLLDLYQEAVTDLFSFAEAKRRMPRLVQEYTKGHLHRGV